MFILVAVLILTFISYTVISLLPTYFYWKKRGVVHINLLTILKRMMFMKKSYFETTLEDCKKFQGQRYFGSFLSTYPILFLRDIDLIKQMYAKDFEYFTDRIDVLLSQTDPTFKKNLLAAKGREWRQLRHTISPAFTSAKMKNMYVLFAETATKFVKHFEDMDQDTIEVEMKEVFSKYTNDIIASCAFGTQCDSLKNPDNEIFRAGKMISTTTPYKILWILFVSFFPKLNKMLGLHAFPKKLSGFYKRTIVDNIRAREEKKIVRPDIVQLLLDARKGKLQQDAHQSVDTGFATVSESKDLGNESTLEITDDVIAAQALIFYIAANETTSTLLSLLCYELARKPEIQKKLIEEIDDHFSSSEGNTFETVMKMKYLDQVVSEALRKWPTAYILLRKCTKPYTIEPKLDGEVQLTMPRGSLVVVPIAATHHDPKYFESPEEFIPDRFSDDNKTNIVPGSYFPFGVGPRNCIGSRFALLEIKCLISNILSKFEMHLTEKTNIPVKFGKSLALAIDGGVTLSLKRRGRTMS